MKSNLEVIKIAIYHRLGIVEERPGWWGRKNGIGLQRTWWLWGFWLEIELIINHKTKHIRLCKAKTIYRKFKQKSKYIKGS